MATHNFETTILKLPADLLLSISDSLPTSSAICLSLTCRHLYERVVTKETWSTVKARRKRYFVDSHSPLYEAADGIEHLNLIKLLERDHNYESCHYCAVLHRYDHPYQPFNNGFRDKPCQPCRYNFPRISWWSRWHLSFRDIYLAMRRHRLGDPEGESLSSLCLSTDWSRWDSITSQNEKKFRSPGCSVYVKLDTQARVIGENLYFRTTQRLWFHPQEPVALKGTETGFQICQHKAQFDDDGIVQFMVARPNKGRPITEKMPMCEVSDLQQRYHVMLGSRSVHGSHVPLTYPLPDSHNQEEDGEAELEESGSLVSASDGICFYCSTMIDLGLHDHGSLGIEVVLETWQNFGDCLSPASQGWLYSWETSHSTLSKSSTLRSYNGRFIPLMWSDTDQDSPKPWAFYSSLACESAIEHPSAMRVLDDWRSKGLK